MTLHVRTSPMRSVLADVLTAPQIGRKMSVLRFLLFFVLVITLPLVSALVPGTVTFRNGRTSDELTIAATMAKELMNPLGIKSENFVVAVDNNKSKRPIAWAQIRPLGTAQRDPSTYNARPGSFDAQRDADDTMWQEFEEDENAIVPVGLASLPWTKEYRAFAQAAKRRRERRAEIIEREKATAAMLYELASVYVVKEYRGQGVGTELIKRVLQ